MGVVVGAAIVREGRLLAARRTSPPEAVGRWELPGGKVEPGEEESAAVVREVAEELGCHVVVRHWLAGEGAIGDHHVLRAAVVDLVDGEPVPADHDRLRWLGPDELGEVDWLEPDRPFLDELRRWLSGAPVRAVFFDEDDARAALDALGADGWHAELARERLSGEDDDEDHPWAVLTDAPAGAVEVLVDRHDGWLDHDRGEPGPAAPPPVALPTAPRRRTD